MFQSRLGCAVTLRGSQVVSSHGFSEWLPAGRLETVLERLIDWEVDELTLISLPLPSDEQRQATLLRGLETVASVGFAGPVCVGGGVVSSAQATELVSCGADRLIVGGQRERDSVLESVAHEIGQQALIISSLASRISPACQVSTRGVESDRLSALAHRFPMTEFLVNCVSLEGSGKPYNYRLSRDLEHKGIALSRQILYGGTFDFPLGRTECKWAASYVLDCQFLWVEDAIPTTRSAMTKCRGYQRALGDPDAAL